jgi:hypothetical protein
MGPNSGKGCANAQRPPVLAVPVDPEGVPEAAAARVPDPRCGRCVPRLPPRRGHQSHSDAPLRMLYRESLRKYTGWCANGFTAGTLSRPTEREEDRPARAVQQARRQASPNDASWSIHPCIPVGIQL